MTEREEKLLIAAKEILGDFDRYGEVLQTGDNGEYGMESSIGMLNTAVCQYEDDERELCDDCPYLDDNGNCDSPIGCLNDGVISGPQHSREPELKSECDNCVYLEADGEIINEQIEKIMQLEARLEEPEKAKPLAQYLAEYLWREVDVDCELLEQALEAYQSTENVTIIIERNE